MRIKLINCWKGYTNNWWAVNVIRFGHVKGEKVYLILLNFGIDFTYAT